MRIRSVVIVAIIMACVLALVSCSNIPGTGSDTTDQNQNGNSNQNSQPDNTQNEFFGKYNKIIYTDDALSDTLADVRISLMGIYGPAVTANLDVNTPETKGEIAFGDTNRQITAKARATLEEALAKDNYNDCGYIIYCEGGSIAVYWQISDMAELAIAEFVSECIENRRLVVDDGAVAYRCFERRDYETERHWLALEAKGATEEEIEALKSIYYFFDGTKIAGWLANLYDPEIGGFYYSNSARDTLGYLPDIESTSQALSLATQMGALSDRNKDLPQEIKAKIVAFAKSLQSPEDGYFYHPQWPQGRENLNTDRYGRDLGSGTGVITSFYLDTDGDGIDDTKQYPNWCAPNGVKCALHDGTKEKCSFPTSTAYYSSRVDGPVATTLVSTASFAVSAVTRSVVTPTAAVSQHPDYSSREAFSAWLEAYNANIKEASGKAHNLAALKSEITQHGYADIVLDHLERVRAELFEEHLELGIEPTGLWQTDINYKLVWGMIKYAGFYNDKTHGRAVDLKYVPYMIKSCIKVTALPPDPTVGYRMNDLYNQWGAISYLLTNIRMFYTQTEVEYVYALMRENAPELISNSLEKIRPFECEDGSIIYQSNGLSMTTIYGTPIALGRREGDVNALAMCHGLYTSIFASLGYASIPLCTEEDRTLFIETVTTCEPIEKQGQSAQVLDFENTLVPQDVSFSASTPDGKIEIKADPEDFANNCLYFVSGTGASSGDALNINASSRGSSCYIFETDIYVSSETDDGYIFQISVGNRYMLALHKSGNTVTLKDSPSKAHGNGQTTLTAFAVDEWHTVRVEFYAAYERINSLDIPKAKIWLDGYYITVSENYYGSDTGVTPTSMYTGVVFYSLMTPKTYIYLDNCFFSSDDKVYDEFDTEISDYRDNF